MAFLLCFIDDSPDERELFIEVFGSPGGSFEVICAETFAEARERISQVGRAPDLFVLDLYFPGGNPAPLSADEIAQSTVFIPDNGELNLAFLNMEIARRRFMLLRRAYDQTPEGGLLLITQVRESFPGTPIISYTRKGTIEDALRARRAGAKVVLLKPSGDDWTDTLRLTRERRAELELEFLSVVQQDPAVVLPFIEEVEEAGALLYKGVRYLLIRPETLLGFQKAVEAELGVERVGQALYAGGVQGGSQSARRFREVHNLSSAEIVNFMARMGGHLGWGRIEIRTLDLSRGILELEVQHSIFAETYGKAEAPVCHLLRGVFAGTWEGVMDKQISGLETRCRAVEGPGPCCFIFAARL